MSDSLCAGPVVERPYQIPHTPIKHASFHKSGGDFSTKRNELKMRATTFLQQIATKSDWQKLG